MHPRAFKKAPETAKKGLVSVNFEENQPKYYKSPSFLLDSCNTSRNLRA